MTHPGGRPRLPLDEAAVIDAYVSGETIPAIAQRLNVDRSRVTRAIDEAGIPRRDDRGAHWVKRQWPCWKRTAHGPHDQCAGVRVHPNTMIGAGSLDVTVEPPETSP